MRTRTLQITSLAVASQATVSICAWGLGVILPDLADAYQLSAAGAGAVVAAGSVGTALALVPSGALIDAVGPRLPLAVGALVTALSLAIAGRAPSTMTLVVAFAVFGACSALVVGAGTVALFDAVPAQGRGLAMGLRQMAVSLGGLLSALLLPPLIVRHGISAGLDLTALLVVLSSLALAAITPPRTRARSRIRIDLPSLLAVPRMWRLLVIATVMAIALSTALSFSVQGLRAEGATAAQGSRLFIVLALASMAGRILWGRLADTTDATGGLRRWSTLRLIGLTTAVGAVVYEVASLGGVLAQTVAMALFAVGVLGANGVVHLIGGELAGPTRAGAAIGLTSMTMFGVSGLSAPALGGIADHVGYDALWWIAAALGLMVAVLARVPQVPTAQDSHG